jgi:acid phosphatase class B
LRRINVSINKGYAHEIICVHKERYRQVLDRVQFHTGRRKTVPVEMQGIYARILRRTDECEYIHGETIKPEGEQ